MFNNLLSWCTKMWKITEDYQDRNQNLILFMNESVLSTSYMNCNSIGMNLFNRFVADENDQFEVYGVYQIGQRNDEVPIERAIQKYAEQSKRDETDTNTIHFVWASQIHDYRYILRTIKDKMAKFGLKRGMITFLYKYRHHCVTKETYEQLYKQGGEINGDKMMLSLGDDLEDFLNSIKNNKIYQEDYWINTFHLSLLSPDQKRRLAINDSLHQLNPSLFDYMMFPLHDVPKNEMAKSESKSKYAFSKCTRGTFMFSPEIPEDSEDSKDYPKWDEFTKEVGSEALHKEFDFDYSNSEGQLKLLETRDVEPIRLNEQ